MLQGAKGALLSLSDKTALEVLVGALVEKGFELYATRSTAQAIRNLGAKCTDVEDLTKFPPILGGRVKTLHPSIFAGILARYEVPQDLKELASVGAPAFSVVACNLYPFQAKREACSDFQTLIENIDIGGVSLLRAAAKNYAHISVLSDPNDYSLFCDALRAGEPEVSSLNLKFARKAFAHTSHYDALIAHEFEKQTGESFPEKKTLPFERVMELRYGENPHQKAALYADSNTQNTSPKVNLADVVSTQGKALSYNNFLDIEHSVRLVHEFSAPTAAILKHNVPCGVGTHETDLEKAFQRAFEHDTVSPFGGVVCFNREVTANVARQLVEIFLEVIVAPTFSNEARSILASKKSLRLVTLNAALELANVQCVTHIQGGYLLQECDDKVFYDSQLTTVTQRHPQSSDVRALTFAFSVVKHVRSNAIVIANENQTLAIAGGYTNRVDAVKSCLAKLNGAPAVLASDAFFPFPDSIELLKDSGIAHIIQPGGSVQDKAVIAACDRLGMSMTFTQMRHFKH